MTEINSSLRNGNGSPLPNCAICLSSCTNRCFSDSCMHQFCFTCLLQWSKVRSCRNLRTITKSVSRWRPCVRCVSNPSLPSYTTSSRTMNTRNISCSRHSRRIYRTTWTTISCSYRRAPPRPGTFNSGNPHIRDESQMVIVYVCTVYCTGPPLPSFRGVNWPSSKCCWRIRWRITPSSHRSSPGMSCARPAFCFNWFLLVLRTGTEELIVWPTGGGFTAGICGWLPGQTLPVDTEKSRPPFSGKSSGSTRFTASRRNEGDLETVIYFAWMKFGFEHFKTGCERWESSFNLNFIE